MCLAGVETKEGGIAFGETIQIDDRILLYAARRPARHEVRYLPHDLRPRFGQADPLGIIGESHALYAALDLLALAARARIHVLLHGETGTGKELFARLLHALSDRAQGPFVSRNAAAFPDTLIEAELFGNARNFPQSPMAERAGMIALGNGGFVFLDEIGRLSPRLQGVLLRALDPGGEYWRLGEEKSRRSDFRMVAATNAALDTLAHDLVPRFKQIIELPPLRDRLEDVPLLVREMALTHVDADPLLRARFVEERSDGTRFARIGLDFLDALLVSDHPLNVRGLEAMVLTSIGWSRGSRLRAYPGLVESTHRRERTKRAPYVGPGGHLRDLMPDEVELLRTIVDGKHGSKARAARVFGCSRHQITRAMDRYGITPARGSEEPDEGE
jgi:two-component system nitrogen regulation response regulator GlnG/two-component system response regulator HydG